MKLPLLLLVLCVGCDYKPSDCSEMHKAVCVAYGTNIPCYVCDKYEEAGSER